MPDHTNKPRIGIYGGTFDPIHLGHLVIAEDALREAKLDRLYFLPAYSSPLRAGESATPALDRLAMVEAAVRPYPNFAVDDFDVRQERRVYSVEAVRHYRQKFPDADLFFLIGRDQFDQIEDWHAIDELRRELTFLCANREGDRSGDNDSASNDGVIFLPNRRIDISATEIRSRLERGESARSLLPSAVADYLEAHPLYLRA